MDLKVCIINEAKVKLGKLAYEKEKEISPKYKEDPNFKRAQEIIKELKELIAKERELNSELYNLIGSHYYSNIDEDSIIRGLSGIRAVITGVSRTIENLTEIEMSSPGFNPRTHLSNLENLIKEELSHIK